MIQLKSQNYIDLKKYDLCVQRDSSSLPYALSWYLNTVCEQWDCLVLNDYDAVWPLPFRRKYGLKYYFRPFGIQQLGIYSKKPLSAEDRENFILQIPRNAMLTDIYLNEGQLRNLKRAASFVIQEQCNLKLALSQSYEKVYEGFNTNLKRKLKKSSQENLSLFEHDGPEVLLQLFKENQGERLGLSDDFYRVFKTLLFQLMHRGMGKLYTLYGGPNQLMSGAFFLEYGDRSIFLFSANSELGKDHNALAYLINEYLIFNTEHFEFLDFEGSNQPGLARFYKSFGAEEFTYHRLYRNRLPWPLNKFRL